MNKFWDKTYLFNFKQKKFKEKINQIKNQKLRSSKIKILNKNKNISINKSHHWDLIIMNNKIMNKINEIKSRKMEYKKKNLKYNRIIKNNLKINFNNKIKNIFKENKSFAKRMINIKSKLKKHLLINRIDKYKKITKLNNSL